MTNISQALIDWYSCNKRDLPWRDTKTPYNIWVSEIILQQTRVNQGINYYYNFIKRFPNIISLANSDIDDLLKIWQGLGYYSRARNMHQTAKDIVNTYGNKFPSKYNELIKLKGIGDYTASAIASISFNRPIASVDGNVFRVLSRLFGISESTQTVNGKKVFSKKANALIIKNNPGVFNQAIMEFGALQCVPKNPNCSLCSLMSVCFAYANDMIDQLPVKKQKTKQKTRYFNYLYILYNDTTFIEKRTQNDIWKLLYQLPLIETKEEISIESLSRDNYWKTIFKDLNLVVDPKYFEKKHILSHQKIQTRIYTIKINKTNGFLNKNFKGTPLTQLEKFSVPKLLENYFIHINK